MVWVRVSRRMLLLSGALILLIGLCVVFYGLRLRDVWVDVGPDGKLWLKEGSVVEPYGKRVAWGVAVRLEDLPEYWRFNVSLRSNSTVWLVSYWDDPSRVMLNLSGRVIEGVWEVKVVDPNHHREWTWYVDNKAGFNVLLSRLEIAYGGVMKPHEALSRRLIIVGCLLITASTALTATAIYRGVKKNSGEE